MPVSILCYKFGLIFGVYPVSGGDAEIYHFESCIKRAQSNPTDVINHPDCVMLYAMCKLGHVASFSIECEKYRTDVIL